MKSPSRKGEISSHPSLSHWPLWPGSWHNDQIKIYNWCRLLELNDTSFSCINPWLWCKPNFWNARKSVWDKSVSTGQKMPAHLDIFRFLWKLLSRDFRIFSEYLQGNPAEDTRDRMTERMTLETVWSRNNSNCLPETVRETSHSEW